MNNQQVQKFIASRRNVMEDTVFRDLSIELLDFPSVRLAVLTSLANEEESRARFIARKMREKYEELLTDLFESLRVEGELEDK
jgi:hypothetical protein